jgi:Leucine-rich repeat (LRR) protein
MPQIILDGEIREVEWKFSSLLDLMLEFNEDAVIEIIDYPEVFRFFSGTPVFTIDEMLALLKSADFHGVRSRSLEIIRERFWEVLDLYDGPLLEIDEHTVELLDLTKNLCKIIDNIHKFAWIHGSFALRMPEVRLLPKEPPFDIHELNLEALKSDEHENIHEIINYCSETLEKLTIETTSSLTRVRPMGNLKFLALMHDRINKREKSNICNLSFCKATLEVLMLEGGDYGNEILSGLRRLRTLRVANNPRITTVESVAATLLELDATSFDSGISDEGLAEVSGLILTDLQAEEHSYIHNVINAFGHTLERLTIETTNDLSEVKVLPKLKFLKIGSPMSCGKPSPSGIKDLNFCRTTLEHLDISGTEYTNEILKALPNLRKLNVHGCYNITDVSYVANTLEELNASHPCGITDSSLVWAAGLVKLEAFNNSRITKVRPFARTLRYLNAGADCGINDRELFYAQNIEELYVDDNRKITTVAPFAKSLMKLGASCNSGIDDAGLADATKLTNLFVNRNDKITTIRHFAGNLVQLDASGSDNKICDAELLEAVNLQFLGANDNSRITTVAPFAKTLTELHASHACGINDAGLVGAKTIVKLDAWCNPGITSVEPFAETLAELYASGKSGICDAGLACAKRIEELDASNNSKITTVTPFAEELRYLEAGGHCGISDAGLVDAVNLQVLLCDENPKITTIEPFAASLCKLSCSNYYDQSKESGISDSGLVGAKRLKNLNADRNPKITTVEPFADSLEILSANGDECGISDAGLASAKKLRFLDALYNKKITTCEPFAETLIVLKLSR